MSVRIFPFHHWFTDVTGASFAAKCYSISVPRVWGRLRSKSYRSCTRPFSPPNTWKKAVWPCPHKTTYIQPWLILNLGWLHKKFGPQAHVHSQTSIVRFQQICALKLKKIIPALMALPSTSSFVFYLRRKLKRPCSSLNDCYSSYQVMLTISGNTDLISALW